MKTVEVEYIESGAFQGCEEDASKAGIEYGEKCAVVKAIDLHNLEQKNKDLSEDCDKLLKFVLDFKRWSLNRKTIGVVGDLLTERAKKLTSGLDSGQ